MARHKKGREKNKEKQEQILRKVKTKGRKKTKAPVDSNNFTTIIGKVREMRFDEDRDIRSADERDN